MYVKLLARFLAHGMHLISGVFIIIVVVPVSSAWALRRLKVL
jgi:hypothetical protein